MKLTGAQVVMECLAREGTEYIFGYPGGANLPSTTSSRTTRRSGTSSCGTSRRPPTPPTLTRA